MAWPIARLAGRWRQRVVDPDYLVQCRCGHYEQLHQILHGPCTGGSVTRPCSCGQFVEKRRERV